MSASIWAPPAEPKTPLGRYRVLSPLASVRVSPIQLGAMSIGDKWDKLGMGAMNKESSFRLLDAYFDAGGNFIDTANNYQDESSEEFIGEWAEKRGIRDQLVISSKYTHNYKRGDSNITHKVTFAGNNVKSMNMSVDASLKKLRTSYIDIFYVHFWDYETSIEEIMNGLDNLVKSGKVLYLGISDAPSWAVALCNQYAKDHGKAQFVIYQGMWNVLDRSFEREIIPLARKLGMALAPWDVVRSGRLRTDAEEERRRQTGEKGRTLASSAWERSDDERKMAQTLERIADSIAVSQGKPKGAIAVTAIAIAYVMQKTPYVFPIVGGRKVEHLEQNIEALTIALSDEQMEEIEGVVPFDHGFPTRMIGDGTSTNVRLTMVAPMDRVPNVKAIQPAV